VTTEKIVNQDELTRIAQAAMAEPQKAVETVVPSNPLVKLPGGFIDANGDLATTAEVRELTGEDEEIISKSATASKALTSLLVRGTVSIGDAEPAIEDFDKMLSGDRDSILIGIRCLTFGEEVEYSAICPSCSLQQILTINLNEDIKYITLEDPIRDRSWNITLKNGDLANVSLPTGKVQRRITEAPESTTSAELTTMLLSAAINSINDSPAKPSTALKLSISDREKLVTDISTRNPGPRLSEVSKACQACGESVPTPLSIGALFRF
jgi:hypothetical protein